MIALLAYLGMLVFDLAIVVATFWAVEFYGWSAWWFLLTVVLLMGSNPKRLLKLGSKTEEG